MLACTQYDCDRLAVRALIPFRAVVLYWPRTHQMCEDDEESRNVMDNGQTERSQQAKIVYFTFCGTNQA